MDLERKVYANCKDAARRGLIMHLGPRLTTEPLVINDKMKTEDCETFDELLGNITERGKTKQPRKERFVRNHRRR